jgi:hypothetical protein
MSITRHGLTIGIERFGNSSNEFFLTLKACGKLTHEDYNKINPMVDSALEGIKDPKIKAFIDGSELEGWEARAAWDDFKFGLKHGNQIEKIAIFGNKKWQEHTAKVGSWFVSGEVKYFESEDNALSWLQEK